MYTIVCIVWGVFCIYALVILYQTRIRKHKSPNSKGGYKNNKSIF